MKDQQTSVSPVVDAQLIAVTVNPQTTLQQITAPVGSTISVPTGTLVQPGTLVIGDVVYAATDPRLAQMQQQTTADTAAIVAAQQANLAFYAQLAASGRGRFELGGV